MPDDGTAPRPSMTAMNAFMKSLMSKAPCKSVRSLNLSGGEVLKEF
jgi:hypothetical protein